MYEDDGHDFIDDAFIKAVNEFATFAITGTFLGCALYGIGVVILHLAFGMFN